MYLGIYTLHKGINAVTCFTQLERKMNCHACHADTGGGRLTRFFEGKNISCFSCFFEAARYLYSGGHT